MKFRYCPDCGAQLNGRVLGDEGLVPWCDQCNKPWFDMFPVATISLVYDHQGKVLLLRQDYISTSFRNLVSGYITPGESAEECAVREILEETGQKVEQLDLKLTHWFAKKDMMMIGFFAKVDRQPLRLSSEVNDAGWYTIDEALEMVSDRPGSAARRLCELFKAETTK